MEQKPSAQATGPGGRAWKVPLAIVCIAILAYGYLYSQNTTNSLAYLLGYNLPIALVVWVLFQTALGWRRRYGRKGALAFSLIMASLVISGLIGYSRHRRAARQAMNDLQQAIHSFGSSTADSNDLAQTAPSELHTPIRMQGEYGELERFLKSFIEAVAAERDAYVAEIHAIGWDRMLDPNRIAQDTDLNESTMMVRRTREVVDKFRQRSDVLLRNAQDDLARLEISPELRYDMSSSLAKGIALSRPQTEAMWDREVKIVSEFEEMVALLAARRGLWLVRDGRILFTNEADMNAFGAHLVRVQELAAQQKDAQEQCVESMTDALSYPSR